MFKRSQRKIVAVLMVFSLLLLTGVIGVIYLASYVQATNENRALLKQYVDDYVILESGGMRFARDEFPKTAPNGHLRKPPMLELSTFYSVAIDKTGAVLKVDTADISSVSKEHLSDLAVQIVQSGKESGIVEHLIYRAEDKGSYTLVAFLDHTLFLENAKILIEYTLLFGAVALVIVFFFRALVCGENYGSAGRKLSKAKAVYFRCGTRAENTRIGCAGQFGVINARDWRKSVAFQYSVRE